VRPFDGVRRLIRLPRSRGRADRDVREELDFHLAMRTAELLDGGLTPRTASSEARRRFGDIDDARAELLAVDRGRRRRSAVLDLWDITCHEAGYAARTLVRQPAFSAGIIITFALAIGANVAMFGVVDRLLLQPAPYVVDAPHVARLYLTTTRPPQPPRTTEAVSYPVYETLRDDTSAFAAVAAYAYRTYSSGRGSDAVQLRAKLVTPSFFPTLGLRPALGRFFAEDDARPPTGSAVVVLSHEVWQRRFGGDRAVLGRSLALGTNTYEIVGVAPPGFVGVDRNATDVWLPVSAAGDEASLARWNTTRQTSWLRVVVRLRSGVTAGQAGARAVARLRGHVDVPGQLTTQRADLISTTGVRRFDGTLQPEAQVARWLAALALAVLLIACANIVNLMLSRGIRRRREIAVRLALGIGARRLTLALVAEGVLLAAIGGGAGLLVARGDRCRVARGRAR
jgi:putative ABC transport system permease protein